MLEYKSIPFETKELVSVEGGGWEIAGYASTWWGSPDAYGDLIAPGAFKASIAERPTKFLFEHHTPIGKQIEIYEDEHGLFGRWSIVDTAAGTDAYKLAKAGVLDALSIGFFADDAEYLDDGTRVLKAISLLEVSAVAIPANANAVITDVKHGAVRPFAAHAGDVRVAVAGWVERVRAGSAQRAADGKAQPITEERRALVAELSGSLRSAADELDAIARPPVVAPAPPRHDFDALRARLVRLGAIPGSDPS